MRLLSCIAFGMVLCTSLTSAALAVEPDAPETLVSRRDAIAFEVQRRLAQPFAHETEEQKLEHGGLVEFYAEHGPLWVDENGLTAKALAAIAEIKRADSYGLDAASYSLPEAVEVPAEGSSGAKLLADAELQLSHAVIAYARDARGGRIVPQQISRNLDPTLSLPDPREVMEQAAKAQDVAKFLVSFQPQHPQFEALRRKLAELRGGSTEQPLVTIPRGPLLRPGDRHPHVALLRQRLKVQEPPGIAADEYGPALTEAVREFQRRRGLVPDGILGPNTRSALNGSGPADRIRTILVNMERWRWLPQDMGAFHVWLNLPEFLVRVMKNGKPIFTERTVIGRPDKQTPILTEEMEYIDFNPYWNVPNSIKVEEILPYLIRETGNSGGWFFGFNTNERPRFLARQNLYIKYNGRPVDANSVDWQRVDIRQFHFYQPPGGPNVLGVVKFMFPNSHDVYMHDTPQKHLFDRTVRAESHGCMRIRNPLQLAAVLLGHDQGWSMAQIERAVASGENQSVRLRNKIPVYLTYFTAWVGEDGEARYYSDLYGHDQRMAAALNY